MMLSGKELSNAQRQRSDEISKITKENHRLRRTGMYGKKQSEHQRQVVSNLMKENPKSAEHKTKQHESMMKTLFRPQLYSPKQRKKAIN